MVNKIFWLRVVSQWWSRAAYACRYAFVSAINLQ